MKKVAVVILNWNGAKMLQQFLPSVIENTNGELAEIIVADNGSDDNSIELLEKEYPEVRLIKFTENYGFTGGYNRALDQCEHEYYVLLNSDIEVSPRWLDILFEQIENDKNIAACQPKIRAYHDKISFEYAGASGGFIDKYGYPFCRGRVLSTIEKDEGQYNDMRKVHWATGACLMVRSKTYKQLGGLDNRFFAHMEEIDLCWRINNLGMKVMVVPESVVYHVGGGTLPNNSPRKLFLNYRNNLLLLYKNLPKSELNRTMRMRFWLDMMSAALYAAQFKFAFAAQVFKARKAYKKMKPLYKETRLEADKQLTHEASDVIFNKSIVWQYFIKGKKNYSKLPLS
ncbi:MAG: glycosyl transferase family 2 [Salinivirgaceae bacterium]|nr:MAG: glycosyl transferase family 2 [Salinivirgaceae bacterium]